MIIFINSRWIKMIKKIKLFLFQNQNLRQTIAKNAFWLSFGEITGRILRAGVVIYSARILGAEQWGVFSYAITLAAMFTIFSDIGLSSVLTREAAKDPSNRDRYFSTIFVFKIILIIILFAAILSATPYFTKIPLSRLLILLTALIIVFDSLQNFGKALFRAVEKMEREALMNIITQGIILIAGMIILFKYPSPENLAFAYVLGSAIGLIVGISFLLPFLKKIFSHFDINLFKPIIAAAWPFGIVGVLGAVMINTDTIMIGWFKNAQEIGFYAAAQKPIMLLYIFPSLIAGAFFPVLARLAGKDNEQFRSLLEKGLSFIFLLALPFSIGLLLTAPQIINLLYGAEYQPAIASFQILALTIITAYSASIIANSIFAYNRQKILIGYAVIGALGNVVLNSLFIPLWGIEGAALSTIFTQILSVGYAWWKMKKINYFSVFKNLKKVILAAFLMAIFVGLLQFLNLPLLTIIPLAGAFYFLTLLLLKEKILLQLRSLLKD